MISEKTIPVCILTRNCLALTQRCVQSVLEQDMMIALYILDNGSTDNTREWLLNNVWLEAKNLTFIPHNAGVSKGWNILLDQVFRDGYDHALVIGQDTYLPPWFCRELLDYDLPFVTGSSMDRMEDIAQPLPKASDKYDDLEPHPDFSAFLAARHVWERVGPFDELMMNYCSDCQIHVEAHRAGIPMWKSKTTCFYHERSSTHKYASPTEKRILEERALKDRAVFERLYGCNPGTPAYDKLFKD